ncbi:hypothetical protein OB931_09505 [Aeromonas media]|uniref:hypothetical protein n=1 Tax=Aeromonas media TaxID=651 RepID=UPI0024C164CE|nr:hypothetical protein [Aeromonas media]MDM5076610.1 hypothetical protein [Aeromonas media]
MKTVTLPLITLAILSTSATANTLTIEESMLAIHVGTSLTCLNNGASVTMWQPRHDAAMRALHRRYADMTPEQEAAMDMAISKSMGFTEGWAAGRDTTIAYNCNNDSSEWVLDK